MDLGSESRRFGFGGFSDEPTSMPMLSQPSRWASCLCRALSRCFGKAGAARWKFNGHTDSSLFAIDDQGTDFAWGGGAQAHFGAAGLKAGI